MKIDKWAITLDWDQTQITKRKDGKWYKCEEIDPIIAEWNKLKAENKRLREKLDKIARWFLQQT